MPEPTKMNQADLRQHFVTVFAFYSASPDEPSETMKDMTVRLIMQAYHFRNERNSDKEDNG